jgi:NAD(P)-dependent dehydrogenase (short-subunit alcohol dehydrogenase family)
MASVLVTGSASGLGLNAAAQLARDGHDVVVHARRADRLPAPPAGRSWAGTLVGDLSSLDEVHEMAHAADAHGRFDAVIHNAGLLDDPGMIEVNIVAPFALTALMTRPSRIIALSSSMHRGGSTDLSRMPRGDASYSDTKLWVTALIMALADRWPDTLSHAVDPGWVPTRMGGSGAPDDLEAGHQTQTWLATNADVEPRTSGYWHHRATQRPHAAALDPDFQRELVGALEERTGLTLPA